MFSSDPRPFFHTRPMPSDSHRMPRTALIPGRDHGVTFDQEAITYLALASESRLHSLLEQTVSAQIHRTTSSHARPAPLSKNGRAMWSHEALNDPSAVLAALSRANKDAEQAFRASRMDRIARETELQRARQARERAERAEEGVSESGDTLDGPAPGLGPSNAASSTSAPGGSGGGGSGGFGSTDSGAGPSTPAKASPSTPAASTPTFGGVSTPKSTAKKPKKAKDVSAEVAHKMSNATAIRNAGVFGRKNYSWLTNASQPAVSSPLAGKKRKVDGDGDGDGDAGGIGGDGGGAGGDNDTGGGPRQGTGGGGGALRVKRKRPKLSEPSRREVVVSRDASGEKKITDDRAVTLADVLFVLEKDGVGRGMGASDALVRRLWGMGQ